MSSAAIGVSTVTTADDGWYRVLTAFARHTPWLHALMSFYTVAGIGVLVALAVLAWWDARRRADRAAIVAVAWIGIGTLIAVVLGVGLKQVFTESRPCLAMPDVTTVQPCPGPTDYSFPSDHTTVAAALAVGLWLVNRKLAVIATILALVEGFSRVYLGQHYPHDIAAAGVLSVLVVLGAWPLVRRPLDRLLATLETTPLRPFLRAAPDRRRPDPEALP